MTERETDAMLRRVLLDALALEWGGLPEEPAAVSPRHARQMRAMCRDPLKWSRSRGRPAWQRVLRAAAMFALVCALTLAAVLTVSPTARARVRQWFVERRERDIVYSYTGEPLEGEMPRYTLSCLPDGYVLEDVLEWPDYVRFSYIKQDGEYAGEAIWFSYSYMQQGSATGFVTENMDASEVTVNGCPGILFIAEQPDEASSGITWIDEDANLQFSINGFLTEKELFALAKSVKFVN